MTAITDAAVSELMAAVAGEPGAEWATAQTCERYLRARNGNGPKAAAMLLASIRWRVEFRVAEQVTEHRSLLLKEGATGKLRVSDFGDRSGRPVLVMTPRLENSKDHEGNLRNLVYNLERACAATKEIEGSGSKMVVVMDFRGYSMFNAPPMKTSRATLAILQNHYPERLHRFVLMHAPKAFHLFFTVISPFIDPVTKEKIVFVTGSASEQAATLAATFDLEAWEEGLGGKVPAAWDADSYFARDPSMAAAMAAAPPVDITEAAVTVVRQP